MWWRHGSTCLPFIARFDSEAHSNSERRSRAKKRIDLIANSPIFNRGSNFDSDECMLLSICVDVAFFHFLFVFFFDGVMGLLVLHAIRWSNKWPFGILDSLAFCMFVFVVQVLCNGYLWTLNQHRHSMWPFRNTWCMECFSIFNWEFETKNLNYQVEVEPMNAQNTGHIIIVQNGFVQALNGTTEEERCADKGRYDWNRLLSSFHKHKHTHITHESRHTHCIYVVRVRCTMYVYSYVIVFEQVICMPASRAAIATAYIFIPQHVRLDVYDGTYRTCAYMCLEVASLLASIENTSIWEEESGGITKNASLHSLCHTMDENRKKMPDRLLTLSIALCCGRRFSNRRTSVSRIQTIHYSNNNMIWTRPQTPFAVWYN